MTVVERIRGERDGLATETEEAADAAGEVVRIDMHLDYSL